MEQATPGLSFEDFDVVEPVQTGAHFNLVRAKSKRDSKDYYLKIFFWNISPSKVAHEVAMMREMADGTALKPVGLLRTIENSQLKMALVLEYRPFQHFRLLIEKITGANIISYMRSLIGCVAAAHIRGIVIRDVKPSVFMYDIDSGSGVLSEFWFAHREGADETARRDGTRGFRAPEVLLGVAEQTTAIDIWGVGVIFLSLLTQRYPFFCGKTDAQNLCQIAALLGSRSLVAAAAELGLKVQFPSWVSESGVNWQDLVLGLNPTHRDKYVDDNAYDLLSRLLEPSPKRRITAAEALAHPFLHNHNEP